MKADARACIAYIVGRLISGLEADKIFICSESRYLRIEGVVSKDRVNVYDFCRGCSISGDWDGQKFLLFHHGDSAQIALKIEENNFKGFDHFSGQRFEGTVNLNEVSLLDCAVGIFFDYSL